MEGKDNIKDLFGEKLGGFEANVRPELWANISTQIGGTVASVSSTGVTLFTKIILGISIAASVATVSYVVFSDNSNKEILPSKIISTPEKENKQVISKTTKIEVKNISSVKEKSENNFINDYFPKLISNGLVETHSSENYTVENSVIPVLIVKENKEVVKKENITQIGQINYIQPETVEPENVSSIEKVEYLGTLPNVFTPNGDGVNDLLTIESKNLSDFSIVIIDNNSKIIYQSTDANFAWDGIGLNGELVSKGSYIYYITARNPEGNLVSKHSLLNIATDR